ncbi:FMN-binding protein [Clostridium sardiniense]|uniref:FMN-binding protein n=1 Tax=Clostridium sardiniense TaxID=29369 RepID=UPI003D33B47B
MKKSKIIAGGILITSAIGATSFAIIDPYNILSKKNVDVPKKSSDSTETIIKEKESINNESDINLKGIKDGTYSGVSKGYGGDINVKVTIENSKIKNIEVVSHSETPKYYENGSKVIASILKEDSTNVDSISGATLTSNGIKNAVRDALSKAGFNIDKTNKEEVSTSKSNIKSDYLKAKSIDLKEYNLQDGEYIGEAMGFRGNVKVKVIIKNDKLADVKVITHNDDAEFFNKAKGIIIKILKNQGTAGVDTISGATYSSNGLLNAVNSALNKIDKKNNGINNTIKISKNNNNGVNNTPLINIKDIIKDILDKNGINEDENKNNNVSLKEHKFKDGEYIGEAKGFNGNVKVKIIIKNGTLVNIEIIKHNDDVDFFNKANGVILKILKNQNTDGVDTISGATYSSKGIINAVNKALKESMMTDDKAIEENQTNKDALVKKVDKSSLDALIAKKVDTESKRSDIIDYYKEKLNAAKAVSSDKKATQSDVDNAITKLEEAIKELNTSSILRRGQVYDVSAKFDYNATSSGVSGINKILQKTEVKLNENGKVDVTMIFKPQKAYSFLNKGRFIIKNGEESETLKPEIKDGMEIFKFTLPKFDEIYNVDVYLPDENLFGSNARIMKLLWNTLRPSSTVAPETNPLEVGNDYTVMVDMKNYNSPENNSMADQFMEKPATISVDKDGVAKLTFRMKEEFAGTRIYKDKNLENALYTKTIGNKEVTFNLPTYDKKGLVWGTSNILAMKMDVKFGLKINWTTLKNIKERTSLLVRDGEVSGKFGSYNRKYPINVNILVDDEKDIFKDLIITHKGDPGDNSFMDRAAKDILEKILDKHATMETVRSIDAVSGATISAKAIKETILMALEERMEKSNTAIIDFTFDGNGSLEGEKLFKSKLGGTWKEKGVIAPKPIAAEGYFFDHWEPALPSGDEIIKGNKTYKAIFVKKADKTELDALIAKKIDTENKVSTIVDDYKEKLNAAKAVSVDKKARQSDVDKAKKDLELIIYALDINLKIGQVYDVSAEFNGNGNKGGAAINEALQKTEVKLNEDGKIDVTMTFKPQKGYSFSNKGKFIIKDGGRIERLKPEVKGELEIFKFTLNKFDTRYNVTVYLPSKNIFSGMASGMNLSWNTLKPVEDSIDIKPEVKPEVKPEIKPEVKPEVKSEAILKSDEYRHLLLNISYGEVLSYKDKVYTKESLNKLKQELTKAKEGISNPQKLTKKLVEDIKDAVDKAIGDLVKISY